MVIGFLGVMYTRMLYYIMLRDRSQIGEISYSFCHHYGENMSVSSYPRVHTSVTHEINLPKLEWEFEFVELTSMAIYVGF